MGGASGGGGGKMVGCGGWGPVKRDDIGIGDGAVGRVSKWLSAEARGSFLRWEIATVVVVCTPMGSVSAGMGEGVGNTMRWRGCLCWVLGEVTTHRGVASEG
ncbi:hypothetical protein Salat_0194700 [Sesamum alatum]|uniref:Uncharacterized protein n=1 Tax=Sesamum alatum TaxID=300844 RepID=A0AAE2CXW0_9LAMI|nr:hypothetical protein Salat_0194700 [Sesamum alatum]